MIASFGYASTTIFPTPNYNSNVEYSLFELDDDTYCLALNIYHEARGDNLAGKYAVSDVVLNRVRDIRWPDTVCDVVYQAEMKPSWKDQSKLVPIHHRCQFSWYCDGKSDLPLDQEAWYEAQVIASKMLDFETFRGITEGATHYHAVYVNPSWNKYFHPVGRIGAHVFYRAE